MTSPAALLADYSLGVAWQELGDLEQARALVPPGTRVHVGFLDSEDMAMRVSMVRAVRRAEFVPVPIIAARRLLSQGMLARYLTELRAAGATGSVLVVAGDPEPPRGPYADAASVIGSGLLEYHGVREVSVAGHPGGHPAVADGVLWQSLAGKAAALDRQGLTGSVVTQFAFDADLVLTWLAEVRARGFSLPVRIGVPGPASVKRLLAYAARCGVGVSARAAREYGFSLANPTGEAGPGRLIQALAAGLDVRLHGEVKLHVNTFGGFAATVEWVSAAAGAALPLAADTGQHPGLRASRWFLLRWRWRRVRHLKRPLGDGQQTGRHKLEVAEVRGDLFCREAAQDGTGAIGGLDVITHRDMAFVPPPSRDHQVASRGHPLPERGDGRARLAARQEMQHADEQHAYRLRQVDCPAEFERGKNRVVFADVTAHDGHMIIGGKQSGRVACHDRVVVHVSHPGIRDGRPRALMHIWRCRKARADIHILRDALAGHVPDGGGQKNPVGPGDPHRVGERAHDLLRGVPVSGEVIFTAEHVVIYPRRVWLTRIDAVSQRRLFGTC